MTGERGGLTLEQLGIVAPSTGTTEGDGGASLVPDLSVQKQGLGEAASRSELFRYEPPAGVNTASTQYE